MKHNITWVDPIVPDEEDRCRFLRYKFTNGQLLRQYDIYASGSIVTTYAFQEDEDTAPQIGDDCLRIDYISDGDNKNITCTLVAVTQELLDGTIPAVNLAPTDIALTNFTMSELSGIGDTVGILSTFDPNVGDTHTYTIVLDGDDKFEISGDVLRLDNLLDYDVKNEHNVTVRSTDQGGLFYDKEFTIFVQESVGFVNTKATQFLGDTINMDMSGPAANVILPSNGSFSIVTNVLKNDPQPFNSYETFLNGTTQFLTAPFHASFAGKTKLSMDAWITLDSTAGERCIASHFGAAGARGFRFSVLSNKLYINVSQNGSTQESFSGTTTLLTGTRYHVAFAFDGANNTIKTWINGVPETNTTTTMNSLFSPNIPLRIGARGDSSFPQTSYFGGLIDEVSLHNDALVTSNILAKYNGGTAVDVKLLPSATSLVSFWRMGDFDVYPTVKDTVGVNNLTMQAMTASNFRVKGGALIPSANVPANISGLSLWADANDTASITHVANAVTQWNDKSGNSNHLVAPVTANRPTLTPNGYGTRNSIKFNGTANYMTANLGASKTAASVFIVSKFNQLNQASSDFDYLYAHGTNSGNQMTSISRRAGGTGQADDYYCFDGGTTLDGPDLAGQVFTRYSQVFNNSAVFHKLWIDGVSQTVTDNDVAFNISGTFDLGRYFTGTHYLDGDVCEVIVYNRALNTSERQEIEAYLETKWADGIDVSVDNDKTLITFGDVATITYNQKDKIKLKYLNGVTPSELVSQDITYSNGLYKNVIARYNVISGLVELYVNGVLKSSATSVVMPSRTSTPVRIAGNSAQLKFLDATVDAISVYNSVVNVADMYNNGLAQDILANPSLPTPRLWLVMGDPPDNFLTAGGIRDHSGNVYHFTANNMSSSNCVSNALPVLPAFSDTLSLPFNGIDQRATMPSSNVQFGYAQPFSISAWVKYNTGGGTATATIVGNMHNPNTAGPTVFQGYRLRNTATRRPGFQFISNNGVTFTQINIDATASLAVGVWYHICATYDGTTSSTGMALHVNGAVVAHTTPNNVPPNGTLSGTNKVSLGARFDLPSSPTQFLPAKINEVSIWNKRLSLVEIQEIYQTGLPNQGKPSDLGTHSAVANLKLWFGLGDVVGDNDTVIKDRLGLTADGTLINYLPSPYSTDVP